MNFVLCALLLVVKLASSEVTSCGLSTPSKSKSHMTSHHYLISISGNPEGYVPGETYRIVVQNSANSPVLHTFKEFSLALEHEEKAPNVGALAIIDSLTKFSGDCPNVIIQTNTLPKSKVEVLWTAPPEGSGCISLKATIVESMDVWYSEEGDLVKTLCEETTDSTEVQPEILEECCACQEAKYEVVFEGLWSRNTFPNNFPDDEWKTRFSEVIGASHDNSYVLFSSEDKASEAIKELAERGNTKLVEDDLKASDGGVRTIIKAKGLQYPNTTGKTYATFRVDRLRHLMSLVASVIPSPDWFVGVSKYELCTKDCGWLEYQEYNLYPWDAGTDDGITYTSPDQPSHLEHPIRKILSNSPNDPRSPFFDPDGESVKPLAKLYLTRQKVYEKECDCQTSQWSEWSQCNATCGGGTQFRTRVYLKDEDNERCNEELMEYRECAVDEQDVGTASCSLSDWGDWSNCSVSCVKTRDRSYLDSQCRGVCESRSEPVLLQEEMYCEGCVDDYIDLRKDGDCTYGQWSDCIDGIKTKERLASDEHEDLCSQLPQVEVVACMGGTQEEKTKRNIPMVGHQVIPNVVRQGSPVPVIHCRVSKWTQWSSCKPDKGTCGRGMKTRSRFIERHASNGGRPCPSRLFKRKRCWRKCPNEN